MTSVVYVTIVMRDPLFRNQAIIQK